MFRTEIDFSIYIDSMSQTLDSLEALSGLTGYGRIVGLSFSKGSPIKSSAQQRSHGGEFYSFSRLGVVGFSGPPKSVMRRIRRFKDTSALRCLKQIKRRLGAEVDLVFNLAFLTSLEAARIAVPPELIRMCTECEGGLVTEIWGGDIPFEYDSVSTFRAKRIK